MAGPGLQVCERTEELGGVELDEPEAGGKSGLQCQLDLIRSSEQVVWDERSAAVMDTREGAS